MKKIVVTGGSGRLGQLVIQELLLHDYQVLSLDRVRPAVNACPSWIADLRSPGDLYHAVVHLGAYQAPGLAPDAEVFSNNVTASYNVLKAAADLGVKKAVMASSTAAFGFIYALQRMVPEYLPLDEKHPSRPQDSYGLSKIVAEQIADSVALLHADMTISSLRFPGVIFDFSYDSVRQRWKDPGARANTSGASNSSCVGSAPTSSMREPTVELIEKYLGQGIPVKNAAVGNWSGVSSAKAENTLGFKARYGWENSLTI